MAEVRQPEVKPSLATVSFIRGQARIYGGSSWEDLSLNREVGAEDSLYVPQNAQVELKDKDQNIHKILGPARGVAAELMAQAARNEPATGSQVISKIKKLEGTRQKLETRTPTAVAGIRGARAKVTPDTTKKDSLPE